MPEPEQLPLVGLYYGSAPTTTERESGAAIEITNTGPLRPNGAGHRALFAFASGERMTSYDASMRMTGDYHAIRREATRLLARGLLTKDGVLPNKAPRGREHVDAYRITNQGTTELTRLGTPN